MDNFFPDEAVEEDGWYEQALKEGYGFKSEQERDDYIKSLGSHQYYICHNILIITRKICQITSSRGPNGPSFVLHFNG